MRPFPIPIGGRHPATTPSRGNVSRYQPDWKGYVLLLELKARSEHDLVDTIYHVNFIINISDSGHRHDLMQECIILTYSAFINREDSGFYIYIDNKLTTFSDILIFLLSAQKYAIKAVGPTESTENEKDNIHLAWSCTALPVFLFFYIFPKSSLCPPAAELSRREASDQLVMIVI